MPGKQGLRHSPSTANAPTCWKYSEVSSLSGGVWDSDLRVTRVTTSKPPAKIEAPSALLMSLPEIQEFFQPSTLPEEAVKKSGATASRLSRVGVRE